jgi:hypothetical protein
VLYLLLFVLGVVSEYHFGLYKRAQKFLTYLVLQIRRFFIWIVRLLDQLLAWILGTTLAILELICKFFDWLFGLLPWWLWAIALFLLALLALFGLGMYILGALVLLALLVVLLLNGLWAVLAGVILALLAFLAWFAGLFGSLAKWLAAIFTGISLSIPTCSTSVPPPSAPTQVIEKKEEVVTFEPLKVTASQFTVVQVQPGDGCIRATARGQHALSLNECITWTRDQGLRVQTVRGFVHAPTLYLGDSLEYKDGQWILHRQKK